MKQIQYSVSAVRKKNRWSVSAYFKGTREIADAHFINDNINICQVGAVVTVAWTATGLK
jgi:hypothetical protein